MGQSVKLVRQTVRQADRETDMWIEDHQESVKAHMDPFDTFLSPPFKDCWPSNVDPYIHNIWTSSIQMMATRS